MLGRLMTEYIPGAGAFLMGVMMVAPDPRKVRPTMLGWYGVFIASVATAVVAIIATRYLGLG